MSEPPLGGLHLLVETCIRRKAQILSVFRTMNAKRKFSRIGAVGIQMPGEDTSELQIATQPFTGARRPSAEPGFVASDLELQGD